MSLSSQFGSSALDVWANCPPSQAWDAVPLGTVPPSYCWVWFKPPTVPQGLVLRLPDELSDELRRGLTLRMLLAAVGVDDSWAWMCSIYGVPFEGLAGASPMFDQPLARPLAGVDPSVVVQLVPVSTQPIAAPIASSPMPTAEQDSRRGASSHNLGPTVVGQVADQYEAIERDWSGCLQAEKDLAVARKQLDGVASRLNSLNRDLTPEEFRNADRLDRDEWMEARRMLRDGASRVTRFIKEQNVGDTTYIGKRRWFEQMLEQFIVPRQPCEGLVQVAREFEGHRLMLQQLVLNMNSAGSTASQMGERKAQSVLARIAAKARAGHSKR